MSFSNAKRGRPDPGAASSSPPHKKLHRQSSPLLPDTQRVQVPEDITQVLQSFQKLLGQTAVADLGVELAEKEVRRCKAQVDRIPRDDDSFKSILQQSQTTLYKAQEELQRQKHARGDMKTADEMSALAQLLSSFKPAKVSDAARVDDLEKRLDDQYQLIVGLRSANDNLKLEKTTLYDEIEKLRTDSKNTRATVGSSNAILKEKINTMSDSYQDLSTKHADHAKRLSEVSDAVAAERKSIIEVVNKRTAKIPGLESQIETIGKLDADLELLRQDFGTTKASLEDSVSKTATSTESQGNQIKEIKEILRSQDQILCGGDDPDSVNISKSIDELYKSHDELQRLFTTIDPKHNEPGFKAEDLSATNARLVKLEYLFSVADANSAAQNANVDTELKRLRVAIDNKLDEFNDAFLEMNQDIEKKADAATKLAAEASASVEGLREAFDKIEPLRRFSHHEMDEAKRRFEERLVILETKVNGQEPTPTTTASRTRIQNGLPTPPDPTSAMNDLIHRVTGVENQIRFLEDRYNNVSTAGLVNAMCRVFNENYGFAKFQATVQDLLKFYSTLNQQYFQLHNTTAKTSQETISLTQQAMKVEKALTELNTARENHSSDLHLLWDAVRDNTKTGKDLSARLLQSAQSMANSNGSSPPLQKIEERLGSLQSSLAALEKTSAELNTRILDQAATTDRQEKVLGDESAKRLVSSNKIADLEKKFQASEKHQLDYNQKLVSNKAADNTTVSDLEQEVRALKKVQSEYDAKILSLEDLRERVEKLKNNEQAITELVDRQSSQASQLQCHAMVLDDLHEEARNKTNGLQHQYGQNNEDLLLLQNKVHEVLEKVEQLEILANQSQQVSTKGLPTPQMQAGGMPKSQASASTSKVSNGDSQQPAVDSANARSFNGKRTTDPPSASKRHFRFADPAASPSSSPKPGTHQSSSSKLDERSNHKKRKGHDPTVPTYRGPSPEL